MRVFAAVLLAVLGLARIGAQPAGVGAADLRRLFLDPPADSRIMMRWWWFGPSVTREELDAEMRHMKEGGIGGFEVATVYPLAVDDPSRDLLNEPYLSPGFLDKVAFTARRARELGLRMDLTLGSGWSFGGPYITPALAATRLRSERREIASGVTSLARPSSFEHDRLVAAFVGRGSAQEADPSTFRELVVPQSGAIRLPDGAGPRVVVFYFAGQTGQVVKRAAVGADGYVLDHYNRAAIDLHLREAGDKLLSVVDPGSIDSVFCDSLEVYDADWTMDLLEEFSKRRGYELRPLLPIAEFGAGERADAIRRDYGRTLTELFEERFLVPMQAWATKKGVRFRIQNYGVPPAALASARHADIVDGEGFEWRALSTARWASSAAHLFNKPVASSEAWTWLHSPAFRATPLDLKAEADLHFLSGINQLIGHGWPYSPPAAGSPGWMFYAAGAFTDKNPWWPVMPDVARYLQRVSFLLRQGEPVGDVALYAPTEDAWAQIRPATSRGLNLAAGIRELIGPRLIPAILDAGHAFDLIDDRTLSEATARRYRAVVVPQVKLMPDSTRRWLTDFAANGGRVVTDRAGADLSALLAAALPADVALDPLTPAVGFVHRRLRDADVYFLVNTSNAPRSVRARFGNQTEWGESWDAMTGAVEPLDASNGAIALTFEPYGSRVIVFRAGRSPASTSAARRTADSIELRTGWTVSTWGPASAGPPSGTGRPALAGPTSVDLPHSWADDQRTRFFSGTASYRRSVQTPRAFRSAGSRVFLDFGDGAAVEREALPGGTMRGNSFAVLLAPPIREAATVFVNDRRAGTIWAPPFRIDVTDLLHDGSNDIRVDVYNTAINQLAEGGRLPDVAAVTERYGQRFRLQDVDNFTPIPSGILSIPRLLVQR
jgi:hypothetical protein